jgi:EmrB/QacA subfamily drug resistance transporter
LGEAAPSPSRASRGPLPLPRGEREIAGEGPAEPRTYSHREILKILSGAMLGLFLAALDQTIVATALPTMAAELQGGDDLAWVVSAYLLTATASTPIYGKLSDLYGRRGVIGVGVIVFVLASMLCGAAQSMGQLIAARALQGLGGGGLIALAQSIVGDVVAPRERGRYQAYISGLWAVAMVSGPVLGGVFVDFASWRWVFWINLPLGLLAFGVTRVTLRGLTRRPVRHAIDYAGAALLMAAVTCLLLVTSWGGVALPWTSPILAALVGGGGALLAAFWLRELRASEPIVPPSLVRNPVFRYAGAASFTISMALFGTIAFLPLFLQFVFGASPSHSGLLMLPMSFGTTVGSMAAGWLMSSTGHYKRWPIVGLALATAAYLALAAIGPATPHVVATALMALLGIGFGATFPPLLVGAQNAVERHDLGTATGCIGFLRSMGGSFGVAALGALLLGGIAATPGGAASGVLHGGPAALAALPPEVRGALAVAIAFSFHHVFLACAGITLISGLLIALMKEIPLRSSVGRDKRGDGVES